MDPLVPSELHDRAADNWRQLLAIADAAGGDWTRRAREAALASSAAGLVEILRQIWLDPDLRPYVTTSLPVAGVTGTLRYRMRTGPAHGFVRAKVT